MSTGPERYPEANTGHWYQGAFGGDAMETNVVCWHSTEGTSLPDYNGGSIAPNLTVVPDFDRKRAVWYQHFGIDTSSRALVNLTGGVETNTLNVCQVEIVGTCDPRTHARWTEQEIRHIYTSELPDWFADDLADFSRWIHDNHGVPLASGLPFEAYPSSYGYGNGVRMSYAQWEGFRGHCGHQHVPENLHGDPGALPIGVILAKAKAGAAPSPVSSGQTGAVKPKVSLKNLVAAAQADPKAAQGHVTHPGDVKPVERALNKLGLLSGTYSGDGSFGSRTIIAYSEWQRRYSSAHHLGWSGADVNGIPGMASLRGLAAKTGTFQVVT